MSGQDGHVEACRRVKAARCPARIPTAWFEWLEQQQQLPHCCRHPENHDIAAYYSSENWKNKLDPFGDPDPRGGIPDIYIFICPEQHLHYYVDADGNQTEEKDEEGNPLGTPVYGEARHVRFCVGGGDTRPFWEIR